MIPMRQIFVLLGTITLVASQNSTEDLEIRVTLLEDDVADLEDELEEVETANTLQDERLNTVDEILNENSNDIDDLIADVDETQDTVVALQQQVTILEALLLQRMMDLETTLSATSQTVQDHEVDIQGTNMRLAAVEEDLIIQQAQITTLEQSDTEQNERMSVLEADVDTWDDRVAALEAADRDMQSRLVTLEDTILTPWIACDSSPCENSGTCVDVNVDTFVCVCKDGYFGTTCSESFSHTSFLASFDYHPDAPGDPIVFNVAPLNPGGHYDVTSGIYTVPVDGIYEFMFHIRLLHHPAFNAYLEVDNIRTYRGKAVEATVEEPFLHVTGLLALNVGQQVWVSPVNLEEGMQGGDGTVYESWFAGHLVHVL